MSNFDWGPILTRKCVYHSLYKLIDTSYYRNRSVTSKLYTSIFIYSLKNRIISSFSSFLCPFIFLLAVDLEHQTFSVTVSQDIITLMWNELVSSKDIQYYEITYCQEGTKTTYHTTACQFRILGANPKASISLSVVPYNHKQQKLKPILTLENVFIQGICGEREKEWERQRETEREKETDRQTERPRERQRQRICKMLLKHKHNWLLLVFFYFHQGPLPTKEGCLENIYQNAPMLSETELENRRYLSTLSCNKVGLYYVCGEYVKKCVLNFSYSPYHQV